MRPTRSRMTPMIAAAPLSALLLTAALAPHVRSQEAAELATEPATAVADAGLGASFTELMSGRNIPLRRQFKDLNGDYRRVVVGGETDAFRLQMRMMGVRAGVELGVYYTKGQTVTLSGETYLIAYRPQVNMDANVLNHHGGPPPEPVKPSPNTPLALSLLNLRTSGSLNDVRPFDPKLDMASPQETNAASTRQLQRLGQGLRTYLMRGGMARVRRGNRFVYERRAARTFPRTGTAVTPAIRRAVYPYVHDLRLWEHPTTGEPYRPNPILSGRDVSRIANAKYLPALYEAKPAANGTRGVLFLDGHVERVSADRWEKLRNVRIALRPLPKRTVMAPAGATRGATTTVVAPPQFGQPR